MTLGGIRSIVSDGIYKSNSRRVDDPEQPLKVIGHNSFENEWMIVARAIPGPPVGLGHFEHVIKNLRMPAETRFPDSEECVADLR